MSIKNLLLVIAIVGSTIWVLIGTGFIITGAVYKALYLPYADLLLIIGLIMDILLIIISIIVGLIIATISRSKDGKKTN